MRACAGQAEEVHDGKPAVVLGAEGNAHGNITARPCFSVEVVNVRVEKIRRMDLHKQTHTHTHSHALLLVCSSSLSGESCARNEGK